MLTSGRLGGKCAGGQIIIRVVSCETIYLSIALWYSYFLMQDTGVSSNLFRSVAYAFITHVLFPSTFSFISSACNYPHPPNLSSYLIFLLHQYVLPHHRLTLLSACYLLVIYLHPDRISPNIIFNLSTLPICSMQQACGVTIILPSTLGSEAAWLCPSVRPVLWIQ
jgi:hypothetical protein